MSRKGIKEVLDRVLTWPRERQEIAVRMLAEMKEDEASDYRLSSEQVEEVERRLADPSARYASLEQAQERFARDA